MNTINITPPDKFAREINSNTSKIKECLSFLVYYLPSRAKTTSLHFSNKDR